MKTIGKFITWVLVVVVLAGAIGLLYAFIGNGQRNFYVKYGNTTVPVRADNYVFEKNATTVIQCGTVTGQKVGYDVKVTFNSKDIPNTAFDLNGTPADFKYELYGYDCTALFDVKTYDDYFTLYVPQDLTLTDILQSKYPNDGITNVTETDLWAKDYFTISVTDKVELRTVTISFH